MQNPFLKATLAAVAILALAIPGQAGVTRLVVEHTETLGRDGYQKLTGHVYGELDPKLPLNAIITDLELAPRNARGLVEYSATFTIIKPADMSKASGVLLYFVPNRGHIDMTNGGFIADARKRGDVLVASGWQADLEPAAGMETLSAPVAKNRMTQHHGTSASRVSAIWRPVPEPYRFCAAALRALRSGQFRYVDYADAVRGR
jgi:hypothetical protein